MSGGTENEKRKRYFAAAALLALLVCVPVALRVFSAGTGEGAHPSTTTSADDAQFLDEVRAALKIGPELDAETIYRRNPSDPVHRYRYGLACAGANDSLGAILTLAPLAVPKAPASAAGPYAALCAQDGWFSEAERALRLTRAKDASPRIQMAEAYVSRGDAPRAMALLASVKETHLSVDLWLSGAVAWLHCRRPREAAEWALHGRKAAPGQPEAILLVARCQLEAGDAAAARLTLATVDRSRRDANFDSWLDRALLRSARPAEQKQGRDDLFRIARTDPNAAGPALEAGKSLLESGDVASALPLLQQALQAHYEDVLCLELLAAAYGNQGDRWNAEWFTARASLRRGRLSQAQTGFEKVVQLDPRRVDGYLELARVKVTLGALPEALAVVAGAEHTFPRNLDVALLQAAIEGRLSRRKDEIAVLRACESWDPKRANEPLDDLAKVEYAAGDFDAAMTAASKAVKRDDSDSAAHLYVGLCFAHRAKEPAELRRAVRELLRATGSPSLQSEAWQRIGELLKQLGYDVDACAAYRRASEADPLRAAAFVHLAELLQKDQLRDESKVAKALDERARRESAARANLDRAVHSRPQDPEACFALGDRLLREGRPHEAFAELLAAASLCPAWKQAQSRLADVCELLDYQDLREQAERAAGGPNR